MNIPIRLVTQQIHCPFPPSPPFLSLPSIPLSPTPSPPSPPSPPLPSPPLPSPPSESAFLAKTVRLYTIGVPSNAWPNACQICVVSLSDSQVECGLLLPPRLSSGIKSTPVHCRGSSRTRLCQPPCFLPIGPCAVY